MSTWVLIGTIPGTGGSGAPTVVINDKLGAKDSPAWIWDQADKAGGKDGAAWVWDQADRVGVKDSAVITGLGTPQWRSEAHFAATSVGATINCPKPAGVEVGDLLLAFTACQNPAIGAVRTASLAGWTTGRTQSITGTAAAIGTRTLWRIADGTEGSSFTFVLTGLADQATVEIHRIQAAHQTAPINVHNAGAIAATALVTDPVIPAVTPTAVNCLVFCFLAHGHAALPNTHTPPASNTERTDFESTVTAVILASTSASRVFAAAATTGTATVDCTEAVATDAVYQRIAIAPGNLTITL